MDKARIFINTFKAEWGKISPTNDIVKNYVLGGKPWTDFMLNEVTDCSEPEGLLNKAVKAWIEKTDQNLIFRTTHQWYTLDGYAVEESFNNHKDYTRTRLHLILEHENKGKDLSTEMWKLIHFRAPLKVLVFYDLAEENKSSEEEKNQLNSKIKFFGNMLSEAQDLLGETEPAQYLLIVGQRSLKNEITWCYWVAESESKWQYKAHLF